jgi:hypothetical protein
MADKKISELTALTGANVADTDLLPIVDISETETKKITFGEFKTALDTATGFVRITGDTMTGALDVQSTITADGLTVSTTLGDTPASIVTTTSGSFLEFTDGNTTAGRSPLVGAITDGLAFYTSAGSYSQKMAIDASGNVGIGTSSPSGQDINANNLVVEDAAGNGGITIKTPTSAYGSLHFSDGTGADAYRGILAYNHSDNSMQFHTNATERMRIDSSGNVGIGVVPETGWRTAGGEKVLQLDTASIYNNSGNDLYINSNWYLNSSAQSTYIESDFATSYSQQSGKHIWYNAASGTAGNAVTFTQAMTLDASGNVGIGTSLPSSKLHVIADSDTDYTATNFCTNPSAIITNNTSGALNYASLLFGTEANGEFAIGAVQNAGNTASDFVFASRASGSRTERMRIDALGNLGLGVTPSAFATVKAMQLNTASTLMAFTNEFNIGQNVYYNAGNKYITTGEATLYAQIAGQHQWFNAPSGTAGTAISFTQAMTLNSSGNVLVGTTSAEPTGSGSSGRVVINTKNGGQAALTCYNVGTGAVNIISLENGNGQVGRIQINGTATSYLTSSDYRLKEDWQLMSGASDRVLALKPVNFAWKVDGSRVDGFLAHEVAEVVPEAIAGTKDAMRDQEYEVTAAIEATYDEDGNELTAAVEAVMGTRSVPDMQGIDQSKLVPLLTAALQEALTEISALKARVTALEG